jgi:hypothetical protein
VVTGAVELYDMGCRYNTSSGVNKPGSGPKFFDISSLRNHSFEFFGSDFARPLPLMIRIFPFSAFQMVRSSVPTAIDV